MMDTESVYKTVFTPYFIAQIVIEMPQRLHGIFRRVRKGGQCSGWLYHTQVFLRAMRHIAFVAIPCCEAPAILCISCKLFRIINAPGTVDQGMVLILFPVIGMPVGKSTWIYSLESIMR